MASTTVLLALLLALPSFASYIKRGKVKTTGVYTAGGERRRYWAEEDIRLPVIEWESLEGDGAKVLLCRPQRITFGGKLDASDFTQGVVITFPKEFYFSVGCALPPDADDFTKKDHIVFRQITGVHNLPNGIVVVRTKFIRGEKVIPQVHVTIGERVDKPVRIAESAAELKTYSRFDVVQATIDEREGTFPVNQDIDIQWKADGQVGICSFMFTRPFGISWEQRFKVDISAAIRILKPLKTDPPIEGRLFGPFPIPSAGVNIIVPGLGRLTIGVVWQVNYVIDLEAGTPLTIRFAWDFNTGQRIELGLFQRPRVIDLGSGGEGADGGIDFDPDASISAGARVSGFGGLRPEFLFTINVPILEATASVGVTGGGEVDIEYRLPPWPPVPASKGRLLNPAACRACHLLEGNLFVKGRDLDASVTGPVIGTVTVPIKQSLFSFRIGTACAGPRGCPSPTPPALPPGEPEPTPEEIIPCETLQRSGGQGTQTYGVNLGSPSGTFIISYEFFSVPDKLDVKYEGSTIFTTGGLVSGRDTAFVEYGGTSTLITVTVSAPNSGTRWEISVSCPGA